MSVEANDMSKEAKEQRSVSEHLGELNIQSYLEKDNSQPVAWIDVDERIKHFTEQIRARGEA